MSHDKALYKSTVSLILLHCIQFIQLLRTYERTQDLVKSQTSATIVKAKFHYVSWFGAGLKLVRAEIWTII